MQHRGILYNCPDAAPWPVRLVLVGLCWPRRVEKGRTTDKPARGDGRAERAERRKLAFRAAAFALMDLAGISKLPEPDFLARILSIPTGTIRTAASVAIT